MAQFKIPINQGIRVTRAHGEEDWYVSSVQDIAKNNFCISVPTQGPNPLVLHDGDAVKTSFVLGESRFQFETKVLGYRDDNIPLYVLALPKEYQRIQLREFVRIPIFLEVSYAEIPVEGQLPVFSICNSVDLSGGGMRLLFKKAYAPDTMLILKFTLPFKTHPVEVEVMGSVVRSSTVQNVRLYHVGVEFSKISHRQQDLIVRFVLTKMSEQKRLS